MLPILGSNTMSDFLFSADDWTQDLAYGKKCSITELHPICIRQFRVPRSGVVVTQHVLYMYRILHSIPTPWKFLCWQITEKRDLLHSFKGQWKLHYRNQTLKIQSYNSALLLLEISFTELHFCIKIINIPNTHQCSTNVIQSTQKCAMP